MRDDLLLGDFVLFGEVGRAVLLVALAFLGLEPLFGDGDAGRSSADRDVEDHVTDRRTEGRGIGAVFP